MSYSIGNLDAVLDRLGTLPVNLAKTIVKRGLKDVLKPMESAAKSLAPVDTGGIRDAIKITATRSKKGLIFANVMIGANDLKSNKGDQFYGSFQEFGMTRHGILYPGKHFMKRAFDQSKGEVLSLAIEGIKSALDDAAKS